MKGVSTVIATILMLMITIALAGTAYLYISGAFTRETAVVLELLDATCTGDPISVTVQNAGTSISGAVSVSVKEPDGTDVGVACSPAITSIGAGQSATCSINRAAGDPAGTYSITATASGVRSAKGSVSCTTVGVI